MSRRRVRWLIISLAIIGAVAMLSVCFLCCRYSNFNFRFGLPGRDKDGELVRSEALYPSGPGFPA